jgi:hypothetical protein
VAAREGRGHGIAGLKLDRPSVSQLSKCAFANLMFESWRCTSFELLSLRE